MMTVNVNQLTDNETRAALLSAGIPRKYHRKDMTISAIGHGDIIKSWIELVCQNHRHDKYVNPEDEMKSMFLYGDGSCRAAYLTARGLLLMGVSTLVVIVPDLFEEGYMYDARLQERIENALVIVLLSYNDMGLSTLGRAERAAAVQWWMYRAMDNGKLFVFQGASKPSEQDPWGRTLSTKVSNECTVVKCEGVSDVAR